MFNRGAGRAMLTSAPGGAVQTVDNEFSGSSRVQNLKLHDLNWGWTKGNSILLVGS